MITFALALTVWTAIVAVLLSVFALADNKWPEEIEMATFGKRSIGVAFYVITIIAGSVTLWEAWNGASGGAGSLLGGSSNFY